MLPIEEQLTILNSDPQILENTRRMEVGDGTIRLRIGGELFIDNEDCVLVVQGPLEFQKLVAWCNYVREEWNARKNRKEAEEARAAEARRSRDERGAAAALDRGRGDVPAEDDNKISEESLEGTLRSKIALLDRLRSRWTDDAAAARSRLTEAERQLSRIAREHAVTLGLLRTYLEEMKDDPSEDSSTNSPELSTSAES